MDYIKQAAKENPFDGLSPSDAKKMMVYFNQLASPRMSPGDVYRRYGFCLPFDAMMQIGEMMMLSMQVAQELSMQGVSVTLPES